MNPHVLTQLALVACLALSSTAHAQVAPSASEVAQYKGLHAAAHRGDMAALQRLVTAKADLNARDGNGRTPLHVATFGKQRDDGESNLAAACE